MKKILAIGWMTFILIFSIPQVLEAADTKADPVKNGWVSTKSGRRYYNKKGKMVTGLKKIGKYTYYFNKKGIMQKNRWVRSGSVKRYFNSKGRMVTNKVVDRRVINKKGIYKVGERETAEKLAKTWVKKAIKADGGKHSKLRACYNYCKNFSYSGVNMETPTKAEKYNGWDAACARAMFVTRKGNCYYYSAAFAFMARELGYDAKVVVGTVSDRYGKFNRHAWVEINGKIYDPEREFSPHHPWGVYGKSYKKAKYTYRKEFSV